MLALSILFFRWHNYVVENLDHHAAMVDEVFAKARQWVIATLQVRQQRVPLSSCWQEYPMTLCVFF